MIATENSSSQRITVENVSRRGFLQGMFSAGRVRTMRANRSGAAFGPQLTGVPASIERVRVPSQHFRRHSYRRHGLHRGPPIRDGEWSSHQPAANSRGRTRRRLEPRHGRPGRRR